MIEIYSDGACSYQLNQGYGGWGAVILWRSLEGEIIKTNEIGGPIIPCTNNIAELTAVAEAFKHIGKHGAVITVYTDSKYVQQGITDWLPNLWLKNGWRTSTGQPVKNQDLWKAVYDSSRLYDLKWQWVKGHATNRYNIRADNLAVQYKRLAHEQVYMR